MIQENIKINYEEICNEYIKPYLDSIGMNFTESYLGLNINENVYLSGWDGNGKSVIIPMKYSDNGFIIVDTLSPEYNPIHFRELIEESDIIEDGELYDTDPEINIPNYKKMVMDSLWEDYSIYHGSIKELKIKGQWV
jgi:hypothetical protein